MHIPKVSQLVPGRAGIEPTQSGSSEDEPQPLHMPLGSDRELPSCEVNAAIRGQQVEEPPPAPQGRAILDTKTVEILLSVSLSPSLCFAVF